MDGSNPVHREGLDAGSMYQYLDTCRENNEQRTAWRQQTILASGLMDVSMDLMEHSFMFPIVSADDAIISYTQSVKSINDMRLNVLQFPKVDNVGCTSQNESELMFESHSGDEPIRVITTKTARDGSRNTMEHFLNGQTNRESNGFCTAREMMTLQSMKKNANNNELGSQRKAEGNGTQAGDFNFAATKKTLGSLGRVASTTKKSFVPPVRGKAASIKDTEQLSDEKTGTEIEQLLSHPALKNIDPKMVEVVNNEIMHNFKQVEWNEIAGLDYAKSIIREAVVYPLLRPDIFTGLRRPPRGILLFGPPGTGKTLIGKCIASQSRSTFFSISSASLTSKWMGEGEKMVRALFAIAVARQPSVIFMDEIDSLLSKRSESENEGTRRLKTEFLVRLDGAATSDDERVLIVGATNRPQELDDAVRRRFIKRLYVPLPQMDARIEIIKNLLKTVDNNLDVQDLQEIASLADGYSGADMESLCREASLEPFRSLPVELKVTCNNNDLRPVNKNDFNTALKKVRPSVSQNDLDQYVQWNKTYGSNF